MDYTFLENTAIYLKEHLWIVTIIGVVTAILGLRLAYLNRRRNKKLDKLAHAPELWFNGEKTTPHDLTIALDLNNKEARVANLEIKNAKGMVTRNKLPFSIPDKGARECIRGTIDSTLKFKSDAHSVPYEFDLLCRDKLGKKYKYKVKDKGGEPQILRNTEWFMD